MNHHSGSFYQRRPPSLFTDDEDPTGQRPPPKMARSEQDYSTCCCGSINIKFGTFFIGVLYLIGSVGQIISSFVAYSSQASISWTTFSVAVITLFSTIFLFIGVKTERGEWLIPFWVIQFLNLLALGALAIIFLIFLCSFTPKYGDGNVDDTTFPTADKDYQIQVTFGVGTALCLLGCIFNVWFIAVVHKCYLYFGGSSCSRRPVQLEAPPFRPTPPPRFHHFQPTPEGRRSFSSRGGIRVERSRSEVEETIISADFGAAADLRSSRGVLTIIFDHIYSIKTPLTDHCSFAVLVHFQFSRPLNTLLGGPLLTNERFFSSSKPHLEDSIRLERVFEDLSILPFHRSVCTDNNRGSMSATDIC
ncbi:hypothetical protein QR680_018038 [Steinernema hermaphroditum]|uniref:Uncharacterized protein n=1 Tax=Steinernema hermaphroditum TaxID=289476 RepID=A0AA39HIS9_9BILA|nr:hypothetical protein QR680_018038 [Steinernema hermaphroditum]